MRFVFLLFSTFFHQCLGQLPGMTELPPVIAPMFRAEKVVFREKWKFPWLSAFVTRESKKYFCAGSLISNQHILSAAHCFHPKGWPKTSPELVLTFLGKPDLRIRLDYEVESLVNEIIVHPGWNSDSENYDADVSIVMLEKTINFSDSVRPVRLPEQSSPVNVFGQVVGWGRSENSDPNNPEDHEKVAREMPLRSVSNEDCFLDAPSLVAISSRRTFCAGWRGFEANACHGDSGSGYFVEKKTENDWKIEGIVSSSRVDATGRCVVNQYAIFTKVAVFSKWIQAVISEKKEVPESSVSLHCEFVTLDGKLACHLKNITIWERNVEIDAADSFTKLFPKTSITQVAVEESSVMAVPWGLRDIFPNLKIVIITESNLEFIDRKSIAGVIEINFSKNQIQELDVDTFWDCQELTTLNLNFNNIMELDENLFIYSPKLLEFSADSNQIETLHRDLFIGNTKLQRISLTENKLKFIKVEFFNLANIDYLNLEGNDCIDASIDAKNGNSDEKLSFQQNIVINCFQ